MEALFIPANAKQKKIEINSFRELKAKTCHEHYESPLQVVYLNDGRVLCLDEEGKIKDLPYNNDATKLCREFEAIFPSDWIVGDVVVLDSAEDLDALY